MLSAILEGEHSDVGGKRCCVIRRVGDLALHGTMLS